MTLPVPPTQRSSTRQGHARGSESWLIVHHGDDLPWAEWVAEELVQAGVPYEYFALETGDPPGRQSGTIVLDSTVARRVVNERTGGRFFWAGVGSGHVVLRIAGAAAASTFHGRVALYQWDADLVGRTEADARRELAAVLTRRLGVEVPESADASRRRSPVPFPGLATVFISYRRADDLDGTIGRMHAALRARLGEARIFLDVADPDQDSDIPRRLHRAIDNAPAVLAVIGPNWRGDRPGRPPRIFDGHDFVRRELAQALVDYNKIPVVVLLLEGARMPAADELPEEIRGIVDAPVLPLDAHVFEETMDQVVDMLLRTAIRRDRVTGDPSKPVDSYDELPFSRDVDP